jgi:hypothetical protein
MEYRREHLAEMECFILAEGLTEIDAGAREVAEIDKRGLEKDKVGGTLLNDRRGSIIYGPRGARGTRDSQTCGSRHLQRTMRSPTSQSTPISG